jgi:hypothetical protein
LALTPWPYANWTNYTQLDHGFKGPRGEFIYSPLSKYTQHIIQVLIETTLGIDHSKSVPERCNVKSTMYAWLLKSLTCECFSLKTIKYRLLIYIKKTCSSQSWKSYFDILDLLLIGDQLPCPTGTTSNTGFTPECYNNSGKLSINTKASILSYSICWNKFISDI